MTSDMAATMEGYVSELTADLGDALDELATLRRVVRRYVDVRERWLSPDGAATGEAGHRGATRAQVLAAYRELREAVRE